MNALARLVLAALVVAPLGGCGNFALKPPENFVTLDEVEWSGFAMRSVNADGVVLAVRDVKNDPEGTLTFWAEAVRNRMRTVRGYALVEERPVQAASGEPGLQLRLGRDEGSHTYDYWVTIFATEAGWLFKGRVLIVEAGGAREEFVKVKDGIEEAIKTFKVK
jgi:hypothetical protein